MTKKQKKSSRKNKANRATRRVFFTSSLQQKTARLLQSLRFSAYVGAVKRGQES